LDAQALVQDFTGRGIKLIPNGSKLTVQPASRLTIEDREAIREHKPALLAWAIADQALALLNRLKTYTLPAGRMEAARAIADRLRPLVAASELDPAAAFAALTVVEGDLTALGGAPDTELADAIGLVNHAFPGARLVEVRHKLQ
jgi:hypothetical protein